MSRQPSIPSELHNALVTRWLAGASPSELLAWINATNASRPEPVQTSRTSIQRLMMQIGQRDATACQLQAVHRARMSAAAHLDAMDDIMASYQECSAAAQRIQSLTDAVRLRIRLQSLHREEIGRNRLLRLAGVSGWEGARLAEKHAAVSRQWGRELAAQDAREAAGLPPEQGTGPLPAVLLNAPTPAEVEVEAPKGEAPRIEALPPAETSAAPKVPESKHPELQPIDDVNRAAHTPASTERLPRPPVSAAQVPPLSRRVRPTFPEADVPADLIAAVLRSSHHTGDATG